MKHFAILALFAAVGAWGAAPSAAAQRGAGGGGHAGFGGRAGSAHVGGGHSAAFARGGFGRSRFGRNSLPYDYLSLPFPFFDDAYDTGDPYSTGYPVAAALPPYLPPPDSFMRYGGGSSGPDVAVQAQLSQPMMIELQNGRYVQVSSVAIDGEGQPSRGAFDRGSANIQAEVQAHDGPMIAAPASSELAPAVLIFRDGHSEQVRDYTIADGVLYARGDYYTDGYWNKKINLSGLNVRETLQANAANGVNFVLPSSPNEVVTRP